MVPEVQEVPASKIVFQTIENIEVLDFQDNASNIYKIFSKKLKFKRF